jgi:hypothetical protein
MELMKKTMAAFLPSCRQAARLQSDALERPLSASQRVGLRFHLLICKWCRLYGEQLHFLNGAAQSHADEMTGAIPQKLSAEARERIKLKLRASEKSGD